MTSIALPARRVGRVRAAATLAVVVGAVAAYLVLRGHDVLAHREDAAAFGLFNDARAWVDDNRNSNPLFTHAVNYLRLGVALVVGAVQSTLAALGWLGVTAAVGALALVFAGWRIAVLTTAGFVSFGVLGLWQESIDTLALVLAAVLLALAFGIPLGILAGRVRAVGAVLSPVLDVMQIMPTFAYLAPMTLLFLIGAPSATLATLIYAIPPAIRITALGIREVRPAAVEAAVALGATRRQVLGKVQLPMARQALILAANQTIMMALSMVVVTALIDAPGLGETIVRALERVNVGVAFDAGLAIVIMAVVLDRLMTGAARRAEHPGQPPAGRRRGAVLAVALAAGLTLAGRLLPLGEQFPEQLRLSFATPVNRVVAWAETALYPVTDGVKNLVSALLLNPLQEVLTTAPWWLVVGGVLAVGLAASGFRAAVTAAVSLVGVAALGVWQHAMETLGTVGVATVATVLLGGALGIAMARHDRVAALLRPGLDAAQTMPPFVYLLPAVALFSASRFTAIAAAVIYAVPPVVRLVEAGIRQVPAEVVEAATSAGCTSRQLLWRVQLPIAREALLLAANQGIVMVLAMVVVGGLVGAGGLGYDVVAGFAQREDFGKGFAAGLAIVLLGIMLDRLTQGAGRGQRAGRPIVTPSLLKGQPHR